MINKEQKEVIDKEVQILQDAISRNTDKINALVRENNNLNKKIQLLRED